MRLIDADKLQPDRMTNRGTVAISQSQIAKAPTIDVLEQIRAEIIKMRSKQNCSCSDCLDIIDKYR